MSEKLREEKNHLRNQMNEDCLHENSMENLIIFYDQLKPSSYPEFVPSEFEILLKKLQSLSSLFIKREFGT